MLTVVRSTKWLQPTSDIFIQVLLHTQRVRKQNRKCTCGSHEPGKSRERNLGKSEHYCTISTQSSDTTRGETSIIVHTAGTTCVHGLVGHPAVLFTQYRENKTNEKHPTNSANRNHPALVHGPFFLVLRMYVCTYNVQQADALSKAPTRSQQHAGSSQLRVVPIRRTRHTTDAWSSVPRIGPR